MKNKIKIILPIVLVSSSVFVLFQVKKDLSLPQNSNNSNTINSTDQTNTPTNFQKLSVLENRCRGCGKCVHIDPIHFELINGVAKVIFSGDLSSQNLTLAINSCHDQAIVLE
ncbi:MAG: hypothetical protein PHN66_01690 [Candidatus Shapirobacteria bacterium]|nr:hypothetical protein [Candidatus Shapirobacteria bacterium]